MSASFEIAGTRCVAARVAQHSLSLSTNRHTLSKRTMSSPAPLITDITWTYSGVKCVDKSANADADKLNFQVAKVGDLLLDDVFEEVTLLGRNQDGSVSIRKADSEIVDRTTGHLRVKKHSSDEPPPDVGGAKGVDRMAELKPCEKTEYPPASGGADEADGNMAEGESNNEAAEGKAEVVADGAADTAKKTVRLYACTFDD